MIEEKGPWAAAYTNDKAFIESDDFTHDVRLYVNGDFGSVEQKVEYAEEIAKRLNAFASRDAEIADLKVVSDHNLHVYQEAASKMRAELADLNNRLAFLGGIASTHVGEKEKLRKDVKMLRDLIPKRVPDGFVSFGKYYAEQESIFNPSYSEMTKFKNKYLSDCEEALAATEPRSTK